MKFSIEIAPALVFAICLSLGAAEPIPVTASGNIAAARQPQIAVTESGRIFIAFGAGNTVYCCSSSDRGHTYSEPVRVGQRKSLALGMRRGPRIVTNDSVVTISAIGGDLGGGKDEDLLVWRSADGGKSWSEPSTVNDSTASAREGLHAMAMGQQGQITCAWLDSRDKYNEVYASHSHDGGNSWSKNARVYRSPEGPVCPCCHPSAVYDPAGNLYVMWRNSLLGNRDMYVSVSRDGESSFSDAAKLGEGTWRLDACPMDGGAIAASGPDRLTTVWRRDKQIFRTVPGQTREERLGPGEQPWAAAGLDGAFLVWISRRPGDLWLLAPGQSAPLKLATRATDPAIAAPLGKVGPVVVAWESPLGEGSAVLTSVVADEAVKQ